MATESTPGTFGDARPSEWPGERLGLPERGPRSVARVGRRLAALAIDWALASGLSTLFFGYTPWATLGLFAAMQIVYIPTLGGSLGHRVAGLTVIALDGGWVGVWRPMVRTVLLALVIPALVWDSDQRGFHDTVAGTAILRAAQHRFAPRR
jgi:uncharacterized RDD family membrane protein YckC